MKKTALTPILALTLSILLSSCLPGVGSGQSQISEAYIQTAVALTLEAELVAATAREAGAALSYTETPGDGTPTTPAPETTDDSSGDQGSRETEEPAPTLENPWMLQSWCLDHIGCMKYDISNRTDSWLQIELKESDTGVTGFFTVRSKTIGQITLIPGQYRVKYTWWCDGTASSYSEVKALGSWVDVFKCPQGFYQKINKD